MLDFFKQAGAWMAQRRMRATLALGGSCALVLQSHIRARASDIDMVVCDASLPDSQIVTTNDAILIDETLSLAESVPTREWIDAAYSWFILKRPERLTRLVPYGDFLNKKGHGVTVRLVNLNNLWEGKRERLAKVQGCASFIPTDKGDFYGLSRLLGFDCANAFGKPENAEELEALAAQGPKCVVHRACKIG